MLTSAPTIEPASMFRDVMLARPRVYRLGDATPMESVALPCGGTLHLKREDLSRVHSFKWRGAANCIGILRERGLADRGVVAASAGNHAQGVATTSAALGVRSTIFMPRSTPRIKQTEVKRFGGTFVEVRLEGDSYDESARLARSYAEAEGMELVHAFDDPHVIAGQGTIGDELVHSGTDLRTVYLPIGGGGMAAGVAAVLRAHQPDIEIVGVEAEGQASMTAAIEAGSPVDVGAVDPFCDGTAVCKAGRVTFDLCRKLIDRYITVRVDDVCAAVEFLWETLRVIAEPAGALGVAGVMVDAQDRSVDGATTVVSGANLDFMTLPQIARRSHIGRRERRFCAFTIDERSGSLIELLRALGDTYNIIDFQYGKTDDMVAEPVIGFESTADELATLDAKLDAVGVPWRDVSDNESVDFRVIPVRGDLFKMPVFAKIYFADRAGALHEFMRAVGRTASICYFNFASGGLTDGRALMGFEFSNAEDRSSFLAWLASSGVSHKLLEPGECRFHGQQVTGAHRPSFGIGVSS